MSRMPVRRLSDTVQIIQDEASNSEFSRTYMLPPIQTKADYAGLVAAEAMFQGRTSPLFRELVETREIASYAGLDAYRAELATFVTVSVSLRDGFHPRDVGKVVDDIVAKMLSEGPSQARLKELQESNKSSWLRTTENGSTKAYLLANALSETGDPVHFLNELEWINSFDPAQIQAAAKRWYGVGKHDEYRIALPTHKAGAANFDLAAAPPVTAASGVTMPDPEVFTMENGLKVVFVERPSSNSVDFSLHLPVGTAGASKKKQLEHSLFRGLFREAPRMGLSLEELQSRQRELGAFTNFNMDDHESSYDFSVLTRNIDEAVPLWTWGITDGSVSAERMEKRKARAIDNFTSLQTEINHWSNVWSTRKFEGANVPITFPERKEIYGDIAIGDVQAVHDELFKADGATLYVVGGITRQKLDEVLKSHLSNWGGSFGDNPRAKPLTPPTRERPLFMLFPKEGEGQTYIDASRFTSLAWNEEYVARDIANMIWGGGSTARLNTNLRLERGLTYGSGSSLQEKYDRVAFSVGAQVDQKRAFEAIQAIIAELREVNSENPIGKEELDSLIKELVQGLPGSVSDNGDILDQLIIADRDDRPYDDYEKEEGRLKALTVDDMRRMSKEIFDETDLMWVIIGNVSELEGQIRAADLGDVEVYSNTGKRVR